ncbi:MAG: 23S rRNA (adenine(2503)-C(2))-methyltransferase RlmN [Methyloceanibacter sp.]|jgi:23S rRNA (adenine2503-C2)-methyltransferase
MSPLSLTKDSPPQEADLREPLIGLDRARLAARLQRLGVPERQSRMRVGQLWNWLYVQGATDFQRMTNIAKEFRAELDRSFSLARPEIVTEQVSLDGTRKWLLRLDDGKEVETVYIPEEDRGTLCISSQVGCTLTCSFCHTGTQKLVRNLTPAEIVGQIVVARDRLGDWPGASAEDPRGIPDTDRKITNVVLMGMGEPLYNFDNVRDAMAITADGEGLSVSKRRITLSTSGVVPEIPRWGEEAVTMLAVSLHAVRDDLRDQLVPINKRWPIKDLLDACRAYPGLSNAKRITFEYVMLKDVNDSIADAKELVRLLAKIPAKINLIPFNPWPGAPFECSDWERIETFGEVVNRAGYASPVRSPRGRDIMAACGQLKSASVKQSARARALPVA